jgi:hypothetical protein
LHVGIGLNLAGSLPQNQLDFMRFLTAAASSMRFAAEKRK